MRLSHTLSIAIKNDTQNKQPHTQTHLRVYYLDAIVAVLRPKKLMNAQWQTAKFLTKQTKTVDAANVNVFSLNQTQRWLLLISNQRGALTKMENVPSLQLKI